MILSLALDCDSDYLLGLQENPKKDFHTAADKNNEPGFYAGPI